MIDIDKVLIAVEEKLNSMTEKDRLDYLRKMGFDISDESERGLTDLLMDAESIMSYIDEGTLKYFESRGLRILPDHGWWINLYYHNAVSKGYIDEQVLTWENFKQLTLAKLSDGGYMQKLSYDDVYLLIDLFRKASEKSEVNKVNKMLITVTDDLMKYIKNDLIDNEEVSYRFKDKSYVDFLYWLHKKVGTFTEAEMPYELFKRLMFVEVDDGKYFYRFPGDLYHYVIEMITKKNNGFSQSNQEESLSSKV